MKRYGIPYRGSKNAIAKQIVAALPPGETLVDLFAGGCAVTHAAMEQMEGLTPKWKRVLINDIDPMPTQFFMDALEGKYADETRWISREDFFRLKDTDPYVRWCWSFGFDGKTYLYGRKIEPWKKALHYARVFGDTSLLREFGIDSDGSVEDIRAHAKEYMERYERYMTGAWRLIHFERQRLFGRWVYPWKMESIERTDRLKRIHRDASCLERHVGDYRALKIPSGAVVYCDIPYAGADCRCYQDNFDHAAFYDWACTQDAPVYVSSYEIHDPRFECVMEIKKQCPLTAYWNTESARIERLYRVAAR